MVVDPKLLSLSELERLTRRYATEISVLIGPERDIPAPDVNTTPQVMAWIMDTMSMSAGYSIPAVVTGKPLVGRRQPGAQRGHRSRGGGGRAAGVQAASGGTRGSPRSRSRGSATPGSIAARLMEADGFSDPGGLRHRRRHLEREAPLVLEVVEHKRRTGSVAGFPGTRAISNAELLAAPVDVLVPAALENAITGDNAGAIRASLILEAANGPVTPDADEILARRGVTVVPDIIANAGGVTVSYFEWVQDLQSFFWEEKRDQRPAHAHHDRLVRDRLGGIAAPPRPAPAGRLHGGGAAGRRGHDRARHLPVSRLPRAARAGARRRLRLVAATGGGRLRGDRLPRADQLDQDLTRGDAVPAARRRG